MTKKYKCKMCGYKFKLLGKKRYTVINDEIQFLGHVIRYDAFDCPACGCQNRVNTRLVNPQVKAKRIEFRRYEELPKKMPYKTKGEEEE